MDKIHGFLIKTFRHISLKNIRSLHRQRAVHINREVRESLHPSFRFNLAQEIKHLLCPAYRKGRDYHIPPCFEVFLQYPCQIRHIIRLHLRMDSVPVGGFYYHVIRLFRHNRIFNQRLVYIAQIAGEYDFPLLALLRNPDLNAGRAEQMSHIRKTYFYPFA